mgnify:FL=1
MADFFTRTVERALGLAPVVRPDLAPLLSPSARAEGAQPAADFAAGEAANISRSANRPAQPRPPVRDGRGEERFHEPTEEQDESPNPLQQEIDETGRQRRGGFAVERDLQTMAEGEDIPFLRRQSDSAVAVLRAFDAQRIVARPAQAANPAGEIPAVKDSGAASPAIHVSIGRVEVRAIAAPPPRSAVGERKTARGLTLEQYLRERNKGRR